MKPGDSVMITKVSHFSVFDSCGISFLWEQMAHNFTNKKGKVFIVDDLSICVNFVGEKYNYSWFPVQDVKAL